MLVCDARAYLLDANNKQWESSIKVNSVSFHWNLHSRFIFWRVTQIDIQFWDLGRYISCYFLNLSYFFQENTDFIKTGLKIGENSRCALLPCNIVSARIVALFIALIIAAWWGSHLKFFFPEVANNYVAQFEAVKKLLSAYLPSVYSLTRLLPCICKIFPENKEFSHCLKIANCISRAIIYWDLLDCPPKPTPRAAPWKKSENWSRLVASAMK